MRDAIIKKRCYGDCVEGGSPPKKTRQADGVNAQDQNFGIVQDRDGRRSLNRIFDGLHFCCSGLPDLEVRMIKSFVTENDGHFHRTINSDVTHLVTHRTEGSKYKIALKKKLIIVRSAWVSISAVSGRLEDPAPYDPSKFEPTQPSSDNKIECKDLLSRGLKKEALNFSFRMRDINAALPDNDDFPISSDEEQEWNVAHASIFPSKLTCSWTDLLEPALCNEQENLVNLICSGRNVFYTGSAGTGKSTLLKHAVHRLRRMGKKVRTVASTGKAALDINGWTTWTFAGWTPGHHKQPISQLLPGAHGRTVWRRLTDVDVLIVDEISMVENYHLERLNWLLKAARGNHHEAFGGVQLVVAGDFSQLPPVKPCEHCMKCGKETISSKNGTRYLCPQKCTLFCCMSCGKLIVSEEEGSQDTCNGSCAGEKKILIREGIFLDSEKFAFCSNAWAEAKFEHVQLTSIHRQSQEIFVAILQKIRFGLNLLPEEEHLLLNHPCDVTNAVQLFPRRDDVREVNEAEFNRLKTDAHGYSSFDDFSPNPKHPQHISKGDPDVLEPHTLIALQYHRFESQFKVKVGMQVILLANLNQQAGLVNGAQGVVIGFRRHRERAAMNDFQIKIGQVGQKTSDTRLVNDDPSKADMQSVALPKVTGKYQELRSRNILRFVLAQKDPERAWPIVKFNNGQSQIIFPHCAVSEYGDDEPYSLLSRTQIPLVAGKAMSIHKAQGMTLDRVYVNLSRSFEDGMMYVALSRARSLEGLKVTGLDRVRRCNQTVLEFYWRHFDMDKCLDGIACKK